MADIHPVHDVVKGVDELGAHCGDGQLHHQLPHRGGAQIVFILHQVLRSPSRK
jgi:hypothetical protein